MGEVLPVVYLNGEFLPLNEARLSPLDRGFLFGDAVYEMIPVFAGRPLLLEAHLERLHASLGELGIDDPLTEAAWADVVKQLSQRNSDGDVGVYLQVSRGADQGRDHNPPAGLMPTVFGMATPAPPPSRGISAITVDDSRWGRCDIKATALLANVLARQSAEAAGCQEAILIWQGQVTEGASSSVIVVENNALIRRPNGEEILPGTTTDLVVELATGAGITCVEESVSVERLRAADEIWVTAALRGIAPVLQLDGNAVGNGQPGPIWKKVAALYENYKYGRP